MGITLKVMAGDRIDIFGKSYYFTNVTGGGTNNKDITALSILAGLLGGPTGGTAASAHGGVTAGQLNGFTGTTDGIGSLFADQINEVPNNSSKPRAFINYIFFDEQFKSVDHGFDPVGDNSVVKPHHLQQKVAPKNGYVYIYVSNQSQVDVFPACRQAGLTICRWYIPGDLYWRKLIIIHSDLPWRGYHQRL